MIFVGTFDGLRVFTDDSLIEEDGCRLAIRFRWNPPKIVYCKKKYRPKREVVLHKEEGVILMHPDYYEEWK